MTAYELEKNMQNMLEEIKKTVLEIIETVENTLRLVTENVQPHDVLILTENFNKMKNNYHTFIKMAESAVESGDDRDFSTLLTDISGIAKKMEEIAAALVERLQ